jgi:hypothetical protein
MALPFLCRRCYSLLNSAVASFISSREPAERKGFGGTPRPRLLLLQGICSKMPSKSLMQITWPCF